MKHCLTFQIHCFRRFFCIHTVKMRKNDILTCAISLWKLRYTDLIETFPSAVSVIQTYQRGRYSIYNFKTDCTCKLERKKQEGSTTEKYFWGNKLRRYQTSGISNIGCKRCKLQNLCKFPILLKYFEQFIFKVGLLDELFALGINNGHGFNHLVRVLILF